MMKTLKLSSLLFMVFLMKIFMTFLLKLFLSIVSTFKTSRTMSANKFMMMKFNCYIFNSLSILFLIDKLLPFLFYLLQLICLTFLDVLMFLISRTLSLLVLQNHLVISSVHYVNNDSVFSTKQNTKKLKSIYDQFLKIQISRVGTGIFS